MSTATIHQTIFATMKTKVSALEKRVLELEEENMALHLFATAGCGNEDLDDLDYDNCVCESTDEVVADTVETLVNVLEMSYDVQDDASFLQVWKEKCMLMNREFEEKLFNEINQQMMEVCHKKIVGRFVEKVVQYHRERIQHAQEVVEPVVEQVVEPVGVPVVEQVVEPVGSKLNADDVDSIESFKTFSAKAQKYLNDLKPRLCQNDCDYIDDNFIGYAQQLKINVKESSNSIRDLQKRKGLPEHVRQIRIEMKERLIYANLLHSIEMMLEEMDAKVNKAGEKDLYIERMLNAVTNAKPTLNVPVVAEVEQDTPIPSPELPVMEAHSPEPPFAPAPAPEPQTTASHHSTCPFNESQIIVNYTYINGFEKFVHAKKLQMDPSRNWNHIVHDVDTNDKDITLCRVVVAKYNKSIQQPTLDDMQYEVHYYRCEKAGKKKILYLDADTKLNWQPSKHLWSKLLVRLGLTGPNDISVYGCRV